MSEKSKALTLFEGLTAAGRPAGRNEKPTTYGAPVTYKVGGVDKKVNIQGTNPNLFFDRKGEYSIMDADRVAERAGRYNESLGTGGYRFQLVKEDGTPLTGEQYMNLNGWVYKSNDKGVFTYSDKARVQIEIQAEEKRRQHIDEVLKMIAVSDNAMAYVLNRSAAYVSAICAAGSLQDIYKRSDLSTIDVECSPDYLRSLHDCKEKRQGVMKLAKIAEFEDPILEDLGTKEVVKNAVANE